MKLFLALSLTPFLPLVCPRQKSIRRRVEVVVCRLQCPHNCTTIEAKILQQKHKHSIQGTGPCNKQHQFRFAKRMVSYIMPYYTLHTHTIKRVMFSSLGGVATYPRGAFTPLLFMGIIAPPARPFRKGGGWAAAPKGFPLGCAGLGLSGRELVNGSRCRT